MTATDIDGYGFGVLIYQIYNGNFTRQEDLINKGKIPIVFTTKSNIIEFV